MRMVFVVGAAALVLAGCTIETNPEVVTVTVSPEPTTEWMTPTPVPVTTTSAPAPADGAGTPSPAPSIQVGGSAAMPDVVCMNLQLAQDTIQSAGVFYSRSVDASGAGRMQVIDRNWIVVAQQPAAGVEIGEGEAVLSVVRDSEPNDC